MINYLNLARELNIQGTVSGDEQRSRCPLHQDHNPSFSLNIKTGLWQCFSRCGGGDFHSLVRKALNLDTLAALEWINSNGQSIATEHMVEDFVKTLYGETEPLFDNEKPLWLLHYESLDNSTMPQWFLDRGFTWETINKWRIHSDPIADYVVIPVFWQDKIVGTVARNRIKNPKYENSPELPNSEILFGEISKSLPYIIICEGALDCLWLWQNGYNATALLGTAFSPRKAKLISEFGFGEVILALDNDPAGIEGTKKALYWLEKYWMIPQITQLTYPKGKKDPQDCSPEELKFMFANRAGSGKAILFA